jgi:CHAT domain-containing protein
VSYVYGCAPNTPCGIAQEAGRWKLRGTPLGDGTVTWASGKIGGIGSFFWMPAEHGALADTEDYFDSLVELLAHGTPGRLATRPPVTREAAAAPTVLYDAGAPAYPTEADLAGGLLGVPKRAKSRRRAERTLEVSVTAMDLREATKPILVGHYEQDAISGAEAMVDRELVGGQLTVRYDLGLYAGAPGTATIVLIAPNDAERKRGSQRGAIVTGLGAYDGSLDGERLTEAVRVGVLRYLTHLLDRVERAEDLNEPVRLATLLLGYNSTVNLGIADSVAALVRGVAEANRKFAETTRKPLHVGSLEIVELFLDTAISAAYEVVRVAAALESDEKLGCRVVAARQLAQGEGFRTRLEDQRASTYWPRLHVTAEDSARMKFLFVGARARAEAVRQQRQPGVIEEFVAQQKRAGRHNTEMSRTLFQLLVPSELKDVVRRTDRIVLVVDPGAATVPWELMQAGAAPFSVRSAVIRQLATPKFRGRVRQSVENRAYVVGDPSTENFATFFPEIPLGGEKELPALEAAEREAVEVAGLLEQQGMQVTTAIDRDCQALDVISRLHAHPYRIVHVAAHGVFEARHKDGMPRTGVVLSDGMLLTAAEIEALENVPDLVFLNCCHLAQMNPLPVEYNKLAYSVAAELIEIGVRAVVVAGWAVEDEASRHFAATFYQRLLHGGLTFGDAVSEARKSTYELHPDSLTWGAFQAYGDPGWRFGPKRDAYTPSATRRDPEFVAPEELLERLRSRGVEVGRSDPPLSKEETAEQASWAHVLLEKAPPEWLKRSEVRTALADFHAALGTDYFERARSDYEKAIGISDERGGVPIRAIEQLANLEARHGERRGNAALIEQAIARLEHLAAIVLGKPPAEVDKKKLKLLGDERLALLGSAYKRLAAERAREVVTGAKTVSVKAMDEAIDASARYYGVGADDPAAPGLDTYRELNWLSLVALEARSDPDHENAQRARRCAERANADFERKRDVWSAVGAADARVVEHLFDRRLAAPGDDAVVDELERTYRDALTVRVKPRQRDSVVTQIRLLARFHRARAEDQDALRVAERLRELARRLDPAGDEGDGGSGVADGGPGANRVAPRSTKARRVQSGRQGARRPSRGGGARRR